MAKSYPPEAVEKCRQLYLQHGGKNYEAIEAGMRRAGWEGWSRKNLEDRGTGKNARLGWVTKYGFENSLRVHLETLAMQVNDDVQDLYLGIKTIRKQLQVEALGKGASKEVRREYREYSKLEIEARDRLDLTKANAETFAEAWELIMTWAPDLDAELAKRLVKHGEKFAELAEAHYGKAAGVDDGTGDGPDAGSDGEDADADLVD